jgi:SNF2 family DNA or RNA helicase
MSQPWAPHPYQLQAAKIAVGQGACGLLLDPGLGKTSVMMAVFKILRSKGHVGRMLVIAPLRAAQSTWPAEVQKWDDFKGLKLRVLHGASKLEDFLDPTVDVHVINPEGLPWLTKTLSTTPVWPWEMLVVDESTRFKHTRSMRFKLLKPMLPKFKRRYILTGSPAPNGLMDLFGQIFILDGGSSLGQFITKYRISYFQQTGYMGYDWVPRPGADKLIYKKISPLVVRMSAADYLTLPPLIDSTVKVKLPPAAQRTYNEMENMMIASLKDKGVVMAANAAAATNKCRQIANGGIYHENGTFTQLHDAKTEAVVDLVEELSGKPALIAYEYVHDLERLAAKFPGAPFIGGGVPSKRFREIEAAWNRGDLPVLLAQPQSVAHGLNLQGTAAAVIWHSIPWDLEIYEQFIRRVWRQGQTERVFNYHIVAEDTVDEIVMKTLGQKDRTQKALLAALRDDLLKGAR